MIARCRAETFQTFSWDIAPTNPSRERHGEFCSSRYSSRVCTFNCRCTSSRIRLASTTESLASQPIQKLAVLPRRDRSDLQAFHGYCRCTHPLSCLVCLASGRGWLGACFFLFGPSNFGLVLPPHLHYPLCPGSSHRRCNSSARVDRCSLHILLPPF